MRKFILFILLISQVVFSQNKFNRGVNLTLWFQENNVKKINFTKFDKSDFENIKYLGCDVVRLPIRLNDMTSGDPDYIIDPLFYFFLDQVVDWAEELELYLILDNHTFDSDVITDSTITEPLVNVWTQMADHYKNNSDFILYEILNEPHEIDGELWGSIQGDVINAIRSVDTKHTIVVGGHNWNSYTTLEDLPVYEDNNLIYTFHFYDPFIFTHQGASWTDPSMEPLANVPFPYISSEMPQFPDELVDTWIQNSFNNYNQDGTIGKVRELIDIADAFQVERNLPVFCGELGVYNVNSNNDSRVFWYKLVTEYFDEKSIPWTIWDYTGAFGLFEKDSKEMFDHDLNVPLLEAIGFNVPPQTDFQILPDSDDVIIYTDYLGKNVDFNRYSTDQYDLYNENQPASGRHCLKWESPAQYQSLSFNFIHDKDFTFLYSEDYTVDFDIRCDKSDLRFDIRFLDTDTEDLADHPWRMNYTVTTADAQWNGEWQHISIPLSEFVEGGAYEDNTWYDPENKFDWTQIDRFEIVSEYTDLPGTEIYMDEIVIYPAYIAPIDYVIVDFTANITSGNIPLEVTFNNNSYGEITSYLWDFGDGDTSTEENPVHSYEISDTFSVSLYVEGPYASGTKIKENYIIARNPNRIGNEEVIPTEYNLFPNYPNPFNPSTMIRYSIPSSRDVKLTVYDNLGKEIANLVDQHQQPGYYNVIWNSYNHPSGIYFFLLETKDFKTTTKGLLIK